MAAFVPRIGASTELGLEAFVFQPLPRLGVRTGVQLRPDGRIVFHVGGEPCEKVRHCTVARCKHIIDSALEGVQSFHIVGRGSKLRVDRLQIGDFGRGALHVIGLGGHFRFGVCKVSFEHVSDPVGH